MQVKQVKLLLELRKNNKVPNVLLELLVYLLYWKDNLSVERWRDSSVLKGRI